MCRRGSKVWGGDEPREHQHCAVIFCEFFKACFDVGNKRGRFALFVRLNEPFGFVPTVFWAAEPDGVAADDDEVVWW